MHESYTEFKKARKQEKDPKVRERIIAVHMVLNKKLDIQTIADSLMQCPNWVTKWVQRYEEGGIDALRDLPRSGRPTIVPKKTIKKIMDNAKQENGTTPPRIYQTIYEKTNVRYTMSRIRQIMAQHMMSPKKPQPIHVNHASIKSVQNWQYYLPSRISCLHKQGFIVFQLDECFFTLDPKTGYPVWSEIGVPVYNNYRGTHKFITVFGAISENSQSFVRTDDVFNTDNFILFLKKLSAKFGKCAIILDRAPQHKSKKLKEFLKTHPKIKLIYLPKGTPQLNGEEEVWHKAKRTLYTLRDYSNIDEFKHAISEYFRTNREIPDINKFIYRKITNELTNLFA